jgi:hypothetical protein
VIERLRRSNWSAPAIADAVENDQRPVLGLIEYCIRKVDRHADVCRAPIATRYGD